MASLLSGVTAVVNEAPRQRRSSPELPSSDAPAPSSDSSFFSGGRKRYGMEEDDDLWAMKKPRMSDVTAVPDENFYGDTDMGMDIDDVMVKSEPKDLDDGEEDDDVQIKVREARPLTTSTKTNRRVVNTSSVKHTIAKPEPATLKSDAQTQSLKPIQQVNGKTQLAGAAHWSAVQESLIPQSKGSDLEEVKASSGTVKIDNVLEQDGSLRMFWLDHHDQDGVVHLVGKILDRQSGKYVSACATVNGIQRNLFVKPRAKRFCEHSCSSAQV